MSRSLNQRDDHAAAVARALPEASARICARYVRSTAVAVRHGVRLARAMARWAAAENPGRGPSR
jgi:hypothetical protein